VAFLKPEVSSKAAREWGKFREKEDGWKSCPSEAIDEKLVSLIYKKSEVKALAKDGVNAGEMWKNSLCSSTAYQHQKRRSVCHFMRPDQKKEAGLKEGLCRGM
jgi:hypothetical protein